MEIQSKQVGSVTIVAISGSIDAATAPEITDQINRLIDAGQVELVIDLAAVDYTSSAGLRVMLGAAKETRGRGGDLRLAAVRPEVLKVLSLSGFTSILKVFEETMDAVASYSVSEIA